jgi:hypothetical protein
VALDPWSDRDKNATSTISQKIGARWAHGRDTGMTALAHRAAAVRKPTSRRRIMTRDEAIQYVAFQMDDTHERREATPADVNSDDRLVGFHESPGTVVFVAVRSHLPGVKVTDEAARALARDYLTEIGWFGDESLEADFVF